MNRSETILVNRDAYFYLRDIQRTQRGLEPLTDQQKEKHWNRVEKENGMRKLYDHSMGGGDGTYDGKWTSWDVATLKQMLTDAGFTYQDGEPMEYISV